MKKLMFAMAAVALSGAVFATDDGSIVSANIVGYVSKSLTEGKWYLIGAGFEGVGGTMDIQQFVSGLTPVESYSETDCPTIQYWDADEETLVSLVYTSISVDPDTFDVAPGWADLEGMKSTLEVKPGFTCWIQLPEGYGDAAITIAGQVSTLSSTSAEIGLTWKLMGNPYPTATKFNDGKMDSSALTAVESYSETDCATIQYWDDSEETLVSLVYTSISVDPDTFDVAPGWADLEGMKSTVELGPCTGFWAIAPTDETCGTITWSL